MSRVDYNEDDQWGMIRWAGAAKKAIHGKPGQAFLMELRAALLALPEARLIEDEMMDCQGEVCALGAVAKQRGLDMSGIDADPEYASKQLGITYTLAREIISQNDDGGDPYGSHSTTPEQRYERVFRWVNRMLGE